MKRVFCRVLLRNSSRRCSGCSLQQHFLMSHVGHMLLPALLAAPCEGKLTEVLAAVAALRKNHMREAGTSLFSAFQWGHYSKACP